MTPVVTGDVQVTITAIDTVTVGVPIVGTAPLIVHQWAAKARQMMLDNMQGRKQPKQPKDPDADFESSIYRHDDGGHGFPVLAFKNATVEASRLYGKSVTKVGLRQTLFFQAEYSKSAGQSLVRLDTTDPTMREDVVRVGMGGTDLRYRAEYPADWQSTLIVKYVKSSLTQLSVLSLIEAAGLTVGVGEWRPERDGDFGTYKIDTTREIETFGGGIVL